MGHWTASPHQPDLCLGVFIHSISLWNLTGAQCPSSAGKESTCNAGDWFDSWVGTILWRTERLPTPAFLGFPGGSAGKESACNVGDLGSIPGLGRSPGEGKGEGYPLQYSGLENSMDSGAWQATIHGVAKSRT